MKYRSPVIGCWVGAGVLCVAAVVLAMSGRAWLSAVSYALAGGAALVGAVLLRGASGSGVREVSDRPVGAVTRESLRVGSALRALSDEERGRLSDYWQGLAGQARMGAAVFAPILTGLVPLILVSEKLFLAATLALIAGFVCWWLAWRGAWTAFRRQLMPAEMASLRPGKPVLAGTLLVVGALGVGLLGFLSAMVGQGGEAAAIAVVAVCGVVVLLRAASARV